MQVINMEKTIKILCVGNSFSGNTTTFVSQLSQSLGKQVETYNLFYGGCSPQNHLDFYKEDLPKYVLYKNGAPVKGDSIYITSKQVLSDTQFDIITFQGPYIGTEKAENFEPLAELTKIVRSYQPNAEFIMHMTWANCHEYLVKYHRKAYEIDDLGDQYFADTKQNYINYAEKLGNLRIIPFGQVLQTAKHEGFFTNDYANENSLFVDDVSHLSIPAKYICGLVWVQFLFPDIDVRNTDFIPEKVTPLQAEKAKELVHNIIGK